MAEKYRNLFKEIGKTKEEIDAKVEAAWDRGFYGTEEERLFYPIGEDMGYIYTANTKDIRSEGMSYGMMICVQMDKKGEFDCLWKWVHTYMLHKEGIRKGYFAWSCNPDGTIRDANSASDGEMYIATSLLFASARWGDGEGIFQYGKEARRVLYCMIHREDETEVTKMFNMENKQPVFVPYLESAKHTDPSYHLPAFFEVWAEEVEKGDCYWSEIWGSEEDAKRDADFWRSAAEASRKFFPTAMHPITGLGPDYSEFDGTPKDAGGGNHQDYRFDAWRTAMNIAVDYSWWKKDSWQVEFADRLQKFFASKGVKTYGNNWNIDGSEQFSDDHSPGMVACNAVLSLAASKDVAKEFVEDFWNIEMTTGMYRYYDGCLYMLGILHCSGKFRIYR